MNSRLRSNISKLYFVKVSHWLLLVMPVILIFYNANHLSVRHLFILQAVYSVSIVALEVPSGYLADVWGRKNTLVVGAILGFSGYFIYSLSHGFWGFCAAEIMLGVGQSFISGTDTALLYDTLIVLKEEDQYIKVEGRMTSVGNFAEALAGITGGFLAVISPRLPFICQACVALIAIPATILLVEPQLNISSKRPGFNEIIQMFKNILIKNKLLQSNILLSSLIGASTLTMAWFVQPFFKANAVPVPFYGLLWTLLNASVGIAALFAYKFEKKFGDVNTIICIILLNALGYIGTSAFHSFWAIGFILVFYLARGIATPVLKDYINKYIPSETRASVLSLRNLIIRGIFSSFGPLWGWMTDKINLQTALFIAGMTYFIFAVPFLIMFLGIKRTTKPVAGSRNDNLF
jgi:MFS family permease